MKRFVALLGGVLSVFLSAVASPVESAGYRVTFKDGLRLDAADNKFRARMGGRINVDSGLFRDDAAIAKKFGRQGNDIGFRRLRWYVSGALYDRVVFKFDFDFVRRVTFKDVYIGIRKLPVLGEFRVGHFKRPYSLDALTSGNDLTFLERSLAQVFAKLRNTGFIVANAAWHDRLTWAISLAKDTGNRPVSLTADGNFNVVGRITAVPWQNGDRSKLIHLGLGFQLNNPNGDRVKFAQRAEQQVSNIRLAATGTVTSDSVTGFRPEVAFLWNSLHVQGEYEFTHVNVRNGANANLDAGYVEAGYWLTGEVRPYKHGVWARTRPKHNFLDGNGIGAWQIAARYSFVDLNDGAVASGRLHDVTAGLNWWLNPNTAIKFNYVHSNVDDGQGREVGAVDAFLTRWQVSF